MSDIERFHPSFVENPSDPDYAVYGNELGDRYPTLTALASLAFWGIVITLIYAVV